jgi:large subunit ribosomal protein L4
MSEMKIKSWDGSKAGKASLDTASLGGMVKRRLMRTVVLGYEANKRQGTVKTKTRGEVSFTENKPFKQKGTGNARRGDRKSPILVGGGTTFGPRPRSFRHHTPRRTLREALRSALFGKVGDEEVVALKIGSMFDVPSTKSAVAALAGLGVTGSATVLLPESMPTVYKSFRNLPRIDVVRASDINAHNVLLRKHLVVVDGAWDVLMERIGEPATKSAAEDKGGAS